MRPRSVLGLVSAYEFGKRRGERRTGERRRHPLLLVIAGLALLVLAGVGVLASPGAPPTETPATSTVMLPPSGSAGLVSSQPAAPSTGSLLPSAASLVPLPGVPGAFTGGN
jgi:hypothetical protein